MTRDMREPVGYPANLRLRDRILYELNYTNPGPNVWQQKPAGGALALEVARRAVDNAIEFCAKRDGCGDANHAQRERELQEEISWLRGRALMAGQFKLTSDRDWGISSNALVEYALGGPEPEIASYPADGDDLAACRRAARKAPVHLHSRIGALLLKYERRLGIAPLSRALDEKGLSLDEAATEMRRKGGLFNG